MLTRYGLPLAAIGLLAFAVFFVAGAQKPAERTTPVMEPARTPFANTVAGSGIVEPETENISIGSPVAGVAVEVVAKVGQKIAPGDPLFRLDDRQMQAELRLRHAEVEQARAEFTRLEKQPRPEQLAINQAQVEEAEANVADARDQYERTRELAARRVTTESELVTRQQAYLAAKAKLARAKAEHQLQKAGAWVYDKDVAQAAIDQADAQMERVKTEIDRLVIRAPVSGEVLQVTVRPGEFVGTLPTQPLVVVGNIRQLHVRVDIDEFDIPRFKTNAPARANLKGNPRDEFALEFVRVEPYVIPKRSLTGDNTERVDTRVLQVIYSVVDTDKPLYVGQQVDVFIQVKKDKVAEAKQ